MQMILQERGRSSRGVQLTKEATRDALKPQPVNLLSQLLLQHRPLQLPLDSRDPGGVAAQWAWGTCLAA